MLTAPTIFLVVLPGCIAVIAAGALGAHWSATQRARQQRDLLARMQGRGDRS